MDKVYNYVNELIKERIKEVINGNCKYLFNHAIGQPYNASTDNDYSGVNLFILSAHATGKKYNSNGWLTFKQIQKEGGQVIKGEKSCEIIYYNFIYKYKKKTISRAKYQELKKSLSKEEIENDLRFTSFVKFFKVFNLSQTTGLQHLKREKSEVNEKLNVNTLADEIIFNTNAIVLEKEVNTAYYMPSDDSITMPPRKFFISDNRYYSVLFHELTHWTGHSTRLNRLNDTEYAFEELVAELGASYLSFNVNILDQIETNIKYLQSWLRALENDNKFLYKAMTHSKKASDYILSFSSANKEAS